MVFILLLINLFYLKTNNSYGEHCLMFFRFVLWERTSPKKAYKMVNFGHMPSFQIDKIENTALQDSDHHEFKASTLR